MIETMIIAALALMADIATHWKSGNQWWPHRNVDTLPGGGQLHQFESLQKIEESDLGPNTHTVI